MIKSKFEFFWEQCNRTLELENGSGAHSRRHAGQDVEATTNISYAPGILSFRQLICETVKALEKNGKVRGEDFEVPSERWVSLQLSPNNQFSSKAEKYTGRFKFIRKMLSRTARDSTHPAAHWVAMLRKLWRSHTSMLHGLFKEYSNQDPIGDAQMREPCEPPSHAILKTGLDDKISIHIGDGVLLKAVSCQSNRAISS